MLILVSGGAASGKSEYAESLIVRAGHEKRTYIATMEIFDAEGTRRAARHRAMRAGKGFTTLECPRGLMEAAVSYTHLDVYKRQAFPVRLLSRSKKMRTTVFRFR